LRIAPFALVACSKPAPPPPPAPVAATPNADSIRRVREGQVRADSASRADAMRRANEQRRADSISAARTAAAEAAARDAESMRRTIGTTVYFDFDKSELRSDTREVLDAKLPILVANAGVTIRIAGHTDERGSGEYNLQLGQRRAASVRDYLVARGVATSRLELVSYGEERPVCQEKNEMCWSRNRRAEFEITAGGGMLRKP
jgi:peptidoglycan-associated lipoprotein